MSCNQWARDLVRMMQSSSATISSRRSIRCRLVARPGSLAHSGLPITKQSLRNNASLITFSKAQTTHGQGHLAACCEWTGPPAGPQGWRYGATAARLRP